MAGRPALRRLVHPVLAVVPAVARHVVSLVAGRVIRHRITVLGRDPVGGRVYRERVASHSRLAGRATDRPVAPAVVTETLREQVVRPASAAVLLRFGHRRNPVQRVVIIIIQLWNNITAATEGNVVHLP
ncbi:MAG: hypothetical protein HONDAALG_04163 [Gammaproteobacteria bacterium]|nr:hypothetical protein [Gammaproteobacteria bacterium]